MNKLPVVSGRSCGECIKCCDGNLSLEVKGIKVSKGHPCPFVNDGCGIYDDRPEVCSSFFCDWMTNPSMPEELKPSKSNTIVYTRKLNGFEYMRVTEAGSLLNPRVLSWAFGYALQNNINLVWIIEDKVHWIGSSEFSQMMQREQQLGENNL